MRDNLKRVNIVLTKDQHDKFKKYAKRFHGSLSQFIRLAAENEINSSEQMEVLYIRPVMKRLSQLEEKINLISNKQQHILSNMIQNRSDKKRIADQIMNLLMHHDEALTIADMVEYLPLHQQEILSGIEELLDTFCIEEIPRSNAPSKWSIIGDINEGEEHQ